MKLGQICMQKLELQKTVSMQKVERRSGARQVVKSKDVGGITWCEWRLSRCGLAQCVQLVSTLGAFEAICEISFLRHVKDLQIGNHAKYVKPNSLRY